MSTSKENLLKELQSVKHCVDMTHSNIDHDQARKYIVNILEKRTAKLEAHIAAKEFAAGMHIMDVA